MTRRSHLLSNFNLGYAEIWDWKNGMLEKWNAGIVESWNSEF